MIRGNGHTTVGETTIPWNTGDFFSLPACSAANHCADSDTAFYWVTDEPLLNYLGVKATVPKFEPTLYLEELAFSKLGAVEAAQARERKSRVSVLLGNTAFPQTRTITHTLWTMFGVLPVNEIQYPHRHQSVAVDFVIECQPDCYTFSFYYATGILAFTPQRIRSAGTSHAYARCWPLHLFEDS